VYGGYAAVSYDTAANNLLDSGDASVAALAGFDMDWRTWWIGSRTQWNVTKDFYLGADYSKLHSASRPGGNLNSVFAIGGATTVSDVGNWQFRFRVHRDFYP
jgi:hypothetical protein